VLPWRVEATYVRGERVFDGRDVVADPGTGRFTTPASGLAPRQAALGAAA
jgi:allantoinase